jgi:hypothetical protein
MSPAGSTGRPWRGVAAGSALAVLLLGTGGCGGAEARWSQPPQGSPVLPDFAPVPPADLHTKLADGAWTVEFSSSLVNVGDGDFHATADKALDGSWTITQDIEHSEGGAEQVPSDADAVWGGDGHEHWHIERYVTYHLRALGPGGTPTGEARTDHKVGFCIYDFEKADIDLGPTDPVYTREGCGAEGSLHLVMGLSPGWVDHYHWHLPGQSIGIDGLDDGAYRLTAVADEAGVFREASRANNQTWVDFTLSTDEQGTRTVLIDEVGPTPT